ncbi:MAG: BlaI/MecI/CopY family transcriptional regulator [Planctomycetota bacterium]|nr:BlaI/MecI/CopY family transcriptional regulator [Planctomycetota bacterium]
MAATKVQQLSRRERQIMDAVYRRGQASAAEVLKDLPDPPSYSAVRALLRILEEKGHLRHTKDGPRYVFLPVRPRDDAARTALKGVLKTFFDGSPEKAVAALLDAADAELTPEALKNLNRLIEQARKEGR